MLPVARPQAATGAKAGERDAATLRARRHVAVAEDVATDCGQRIGRRA
jgi:hypothetical protein